MVWWAWLVTVTILPTGEIEHEQRALARYPDRVTCEASAQSMNRRMRQPGDRSTATAALVVCKEEQ
jgi:hypothetical protein